MKIENSAAPRTEDFIARGLRESREFWNSPEGRKIRAERAKESAIKEVRDMEAKFGLKHKTPTRKK